MAHLTLAGLSEDGKRLLLVSDKGVEFTLDIDARLRAALRGEHARLGQLEITMDSALRPRDIQARIRAGETPEAVAAGRPDHASTRSCRSPARCWPSASTSPSAPSARPYAARPASAGGARTLGDAVAAHLRAAQRRPRHRRVGRLAPRGRPLDAHRRATPPPERSGTADVHLRRPRQLRRRSTTTTPAGWSARPCAGAPRRPSATTCEQARQRRLSAVPEDELPLGDDAIELVTRASPVEPSA